MLHYIEGPYNILANNLSQLHRLAKQAQITEQKKLIEQAVVLDDDDNQGYFMDQEFSGLYEDDIWEWLERCLNLPESNHPDQNPWNYAHIHKLQQQDIILLALQEKYPGNDIHMEMDNGVDDIMC